MQLFIFTDGGARGNPGPAAAGIVIKDAQNKVVATFGEYLGETTNNQAEYRALVLALKKAEEIGGTELQCFADSELMVKQLNHEYKMKNQELAPLYLKIHNLSLSFKKISFKHIPREKNKEADKLVNEVLDNQIK
ncbi:MAG: ribonuclease HI family protein [Candidatus Magasanikbacteria bacterium]|nr:ribonuclease HI family protein [Candidatus Magasanikbacteria bacterium]